MCDACKHPPINCAHCKKLIPKPSKKQRLSSRRDSAVCSRKCQNDALSLRRKIYNPMRDRADVRSKCATSLRVMKWKPQVRGGNGQPLPLEQLLLAAALGWNTEVAVPTKKGRSSGYPTCYKLDIGNSELKIGIEIDGRGHRALARRVQDAKKEHLLQAMGWTILRFSKKRAVENFQECLQSVLAAIP